MPADLCRWAYVRPAPRRSGTRLPGRAASALDPRKAGRLPTGEVTAVPVLVGRAFEALLDIETGAIPRRRHHLGRTQAPASRTADEEQRRLRAGAEPCEFSRKLIGEMGVGRTARKPLPFDQKRLLADGRKIGNTYEGPLGPGADVYEYRIGFFSEPSPRLLDFYMPNASVQI